MTDGKNHSFYRVLEEGERIMRMYRHAVWSQTLSMALFCVLLLLPFFLLFPLFRLHFLGVGIFIFLLVLALVFGFRQWYAWQGSAFIITNRRIIHVDQNGFFHQAVSECALPKIQDVRYSLKGAWQTICRMGTIEIDVAGSDARWKIPSLHEPQAVQKALREVQSMKDDESAELSLSEALAIMENVRFRLGEEKFEKLMRIVR